MLIHSCHVYRPKWNNLAERPIALETDEMRRGENSALAERVAFRVQRGGMRISRRAKNSQHAFIARDYGNFDANARIANLSIIYRTHDYKICKLAATRTRRMEI